MKTIRVAFITQKIKQAYASLEKGRFEDAQLFRHIARAIVDMKTNPCVGTKIPRAVWPRVYVKEYGITNLWKYDLPNAWRLIYTIEQDEVCIVSIILEWFDHKEYERRFGY